MSYRYAVSLAEIFSRTKLISVKHLLSQRQLRWLEHVIQMPSNCLPRQLFYRELSLEQWLANRPKKWYICHMRDVLLKCSIKTSDVEASANDRDTWKAVCTEGLSSLMNVWISASEKRCPNRHVASLKANTGPRCAHCSGLCALEFRLRSHLPSEPLVQACWHLAVQRRRQKNLRISAASAAAASFNARGSPRLI